MLKRIANNNMSAFVFLLNIQMGRWRPGATLRNRTKSRGQEGCFDSERQAGWPSPSDSALEMPGKEDSTHPQSSDKSCRSSYRDGMCARFLCLPCRYQAQSIRCHHPSKRMLRLSNLRGVSRRSLMERIEHRARPSEAFVATRAFGWPRAAPCVEWVGKAIRQATAHPS